MTKKVITNIHNKMICSIILISTGPRHEHRSPAKNALMVKPKNPAVKIMSMQEANTRLFGNRSKEATNNSATVAAVIIKSSKASPLINLATPAKASENDVAATKIFSQIVRTLQFFTRWFPYNSFIKFIIHHYSP